MSRDRLDEILFDSFVGGDSIMSVGDSEEEELKRRHLQKSALFDRMMGLAEEKWPGFEAALSRTIKRIEELEAKASAVQA